MANERQDMQDAFMKARLYHAELNEIYRWFMPYRQSTSQRSPEGQGASEGQARTDHIFDGTGMAAAFNFAGTMVADWLPLGADFFKLEAGPLVSDEDKPQLNIELDKITKMVHAVTPKMRLTAHEMFTDYFAGTGAMFTNFGNAKHLIRTQCAPVNELAMEEGPFGDMWSVWWKRNYFGRHLEALWPKGKFSDKLNQVIKNSASTNQPVEIIQSTRYCPEEDRWCLKVYATADDTDAIIFGENYRTSPWQTPRCFKVPGEAFGRGFAHLGLPFVKGNNKVRELALRAAAFALMGLWMQRNDGVFNPDTAVFKPLQFWKVGSTGGPLGPTLQRLPVPENFDISTILMKDEREQTNKVLLNDDLPELQDSVRSPTEIAARLRRASKNKGGAGLRLALEFIDPFAQRVIDILESQGKLGTNLTIDQMLTKVTITSPAAAAQRTENVQRAIDWMQMIVGLTGEQGLMLTTKVEELMPEIGRWMGNDERFIRSKGEQKEMKDMIAQMVAAQSKAQAAGAQKPPAPGSMQVNGGAM